jgi:hypothetical protein
MSRRNDRCRTKATVCLAVASLAFVLAPRIAGAGISVAEPSGSADAAFIAGLKAALEEVVAGAPALDGELRTSAAVKDDGVELIVELAPAGDGASFRETRVASWASALSQARAMARFAIQARREATAAPEIEPKPPAPDVAPEPVLVPVGPRLGPPPPLTLGQLRGYDAAMRARESRRRTAGALLIPEPFYAGTAALTVLLISLAGSCLSCDADEDAETDWRDGAEDILWSPYFPVAGVVSVIAASALTTAIHNRSYSYRTRFSATLLGNTIGFVLDFGLMSLLYFETDSAAALIAPTIVGFVVLPPLGGAVGSYLSRRDVEWIRPSASEKRVSFSLPVPTAIAASDGSTAPGLAFGGTF